MVRSGTSELTNKPVRSRESKRGKKNYVNIAVVTTAIKDPLAKERGRKESERCVRTRVQVDLLKKQKH